jgi:hypothetical protein
MKARVLQASGGEPLSGRSLARTTKRARGAESDIIEQDDEDVGGASRRAAAGSAGTSYPDPLRRRSSGRPACGPESGVLPVRGHPCLPFLPPILVRDVAVAFVTMRSRKGETKCVEDPHRQSGQGWSIRLQAGGSTLAEFSGGCGKIFRVRVDSRAVGWSSGLAARK